MQDIVFINPGNAKAIYQDLSNKLSAIEPPTWALLLAETCRKFNFKVSIIDVNAEKLSNEEVYEKLLSYKPRLICFVVYGQNVNAGTVSMSGAKSLAEFLKNKNNEFKISLIGSYIQALPVKTLMDEKSFDFGFTNEGVFSLLNVLKIKDFTFENLKDVKGLAVRNKNEVYLTLPERIVPQEELETYLPGYAWDLLPFDKKPLDLYRSPLWHANYDEEKRTPYAAIQTSLGCNFGCNFCMINIINRDDNNEIGVASDYKKMRYWPTNLILNEFKKLIDMGVNTIRIVDEMFLLNQKYYLPLVEGLINLNKRNKLLLWAYSRIDTVRRREILDKLKLAGFNWLALGIESGNKKVRLEVDKGKFEDVDIKKVVEQVHDSGIEIMANYIYGLPGDTLESIAETFNLSIDLCTAGWNTYAAMALPGSRLYKDALKNNLPLPKNYEEFSFHSYESFPLRNENLSEKQILKERDEAFIKYHSNKKFLNRINKLFGKKALQNIEEMCNVKLKRKIFEISD